MVDDAEKFADEDKARKNVIEMANKADSFCADTDKGTRSFILVTALLSSTMR